MADHPSDLRTKNYSDQSLRAAYIEMYRDGELVSSGTCFFANTADGPVLVTNRHNFTGTNNFTGQPLSRYGTRPNHGVVFLEAGMPGLVAYPFDLYLDASEASPAWAEHPELGPRADIVGLRTGELGDNNAVSEHRWLDVDPINWHRWNTGSLVNVIGFPFGVLSGPFGIWSTGYIASEPDFDFADLPVFLIDCRARPGQSGSPVFAYILPGEVAKGRDGREYEARRRMHFFAGIYSGRINQDSDLGMVWKPEAVQSVVSHTIKSSPRLQAAAVAHAHQIQEPKAYSLSGEQDGLPTASPDWSIN